MVAKIEKKKVKPMFGGTHVTNPGRTESFIPGAELRKATTYAREYHGWTLL